MNLWPLGQTGRANKQSERTRKIASFPRAVIVNSQHKLLPCAGGHRWAESLAPDQRARGLGAALPGQAEACDRQRGDVTKAGLQSEGLRLLLADAELVQLIRLGVSVSVPVSLQLGDDLFDDPGARNPTVQDLVLALAVYPGLADHLRLALGINLLSSFFHRRG